MFFRGAKGVGSRDKRISNCQMNWGQRSLGCCLCLVHCVPTSVCGVWGVAGRTCCVPVCAYAWLSLHFWLCPLLFHHLVSPSLQFKVLGKGRRPTLGLMPPLATTLWDVTSPPPTASTMGVLSRSTPVVELQVGWAQLCTGAVPTFRSTWEIQNGPDWGLVLHSGQGHKQLPRIYLVEMEES